MLLAAIYLGLLSRAAPEVVAPLRDLLTRLSQRGRATPAASTLSR
jgi:hypothetical protein